ncbi:hypothetical protein E3N88_28507 [Mikania micrantha]|uniref:Uncharacterized protein n=1 Tax=Mikania micrantha TaxID=192012 RepID=A0A5N6N0N8_9ASTR|nr:hypothetical protein E3N88_28507 [Mikania micrantha]
MSQDPNEGTSNPVGSLVPTQSPSLAPTINDAVELTPEGIREHFPRLQELMAEYVREERLRGVRVRLAYKEEPVVSALPHSGVETHTPVQTTSMFANSFATTPSLVFETPQSLFQNNLDMFSSQTQRSNMTACPIGSSLPMAEPMPYYTSIPSTGQMMPFPPYSQHLTTNAISSSGENLVLPNFSTYLHNHVTSGIGNNHVAGNFPAYMPGQTTVQPTGNYNPLHHIYPHTQPYISFPFHTETLHTTQSMENPQHTAEMIDELSRPYVPTTHTKFSPRIANFPFPPKTKMPANVKTYDGLGDPDDHLELFTGAAIIER